MHSAMTDRERLLAWRAARSGCAPIIIGTRSAVFLLLANPESSSSTKSTTLFKQQEGLRYSARISVVKRAQLEKTVARQRDAEP